MVNKNFFSLETLYNLYVFIRIEKPAFPHVVTSLMASMLRETMVDNLWLLPCDASFKSKSNGAIGAFTLFKCLSHPNYRVSRTKNVPLSHKNVPFILGNSTSKHFYGALELFLGHTDSRMSNSF